MRVAAVIPLYVPGSRVGAWVSTHECLKALVAVGHEVDVCSFIAAGDPYEFEGVRVFPGKRSLHELIDNADVLISHHGDGDYAHSRAVNRGVPSVRIFNAEVSRTARNSIRGKRVPDLAVYVADWMVDAIDLPCPSVVVPSVVWPDEHRTEPGDRVTLVNLCENKGGKVFEQVARLMPDVGFLGVIGGYGSQMVPRLPNVDVMATTEDMREVWSRTRVLMMPSAYETSGRVGIEAMMSGIPVVCHPTPGLLETQGPNGIFVDRARPAEWVAALRELLVPEVWEARSAEALARAQERDPLGALAVFVTAIEALV